jgi:hypothetical protein
VKKRVLGQYLAAYKEDGRWYIHLKRGGLILGSAAWCDRWQRYVFCPNEITEFSSDYLAAIVIFLVSLG